MTTPHEEIAELRQLLDDITPHIETLGKHSQDFIHDITKHLEKDGDQLFVTQKQLSWLRNINNVLIRNRADIG